MNLHLLNGPNLNLLGKRRPEVYGHRSFDDFLEELKGDFETGHIKLHYFQSNSEGALIDELHRIGFSADGILLNAGAYTHSSIAIADAIEAIESPVLEIHISNIHARESFRQHSYLTRNCIGIVAGLGLEGYRLGIEFFLNKKV